MVISKLEVTNFRNYKKGVINFNPFLNVLVGSNAQGKTNILEAIFLCTVGRGWRTKKDKELIKWNEEFLNIKLDIKKEYGNETIEIFLNKEKKIIKINSIPITKTSGLLGKLNCVFFSPDELKLIKEAPADRRRFLDIDISQIDKEYFFALTKYNKILAQRNTLLKKPKEQILETIGIWDAELKKYGKIIIDKRKSFLESLKPIIKKEHSFLTDSKEEIEIEYQTTGLNFNLEKDLILKYTTVGPHRDDIKISINEKDVRDFASQGQQRTAALSLKLAELTVFKNITGETPLLLLDDVLSELDMQRQENLLKRVQTLQCVITATEFKSDKKANVFYIKNGQISC
ncbi:MAG: DNA replication/repair protein RecF [Firmicutes bacterium]|nr:DNA replication/repair protein RecF [Bacillota bacterium]